VQDQRRHRGEPLADIARSYNVSPSTFPSRQRVRRPTNDLWRLYFPIRLQGNSQSLLWRRSGYRPENRLRERSRRKGRDLDAPTNGNLAQLFPRQQRDREAALRRRQPKELPSPSRKEIAGQGRQGRPRPGASVDGQPRHQLKRGDAIGNIMGGDPVFRVARACRST
jgi:hypothetical protein